MRPAPDRDGGPEGDSDPPPDYEARAHDICLRLLTVRARTRVELAAALARRGIPEEPVERVLDRLAEVGLVDDAAVAQAVVETYTARGLARRAVAAKLHQRGVPDDAVGAALAGLPPDQEIDGARALVSRRQRQLSGLPPQTQARRLAGQLARRGYSAEVVSRVVREAVAQLDP